MSKERTENGVTKRLVKWATNKRKSGSRKWRHRWVVVPSKSKSEKS